MLSAPLSDWGGTAWRMATPCRTRLGQRDARSEQMRAAATSDAARKPATSREHVRVLSQRSSGASDGSTAVRPAVNMDGVAARVPAT